MPAHRVLGSLQVMGLNGSDDCEMFGGITVSQVGIERFRSRDRPPSLLFYTEDLVNNTDDKAVAACLHYAAMKKLIPSIPGRPVFGYRCVGRVSLHERKVGWFRPQGG